MAKAVLVMDMPESCSKCKFLYEFQGIKKGCHSILLPRNGMIGVRSGNCRRKQIILLIVIMGDLIKAGMPAWTRYWRRR